MSLRLVVSGSVRSVIFQRHEAHVVTTLENLLHLVVAVLPPLGGTGTCRHEAGKTVLGNDNVLMEGAHISHDTKVANRCVFGYGTKIAGDCLIEDGVIFSSSVIENAKTRVGEGAMIQAGTTFSKDVPPYIICTKRSEYGGVNYTMGKFYGVDEKTLKHIANAYRLVFMGQTSVFDAVMQIEQQVPDGPQIRHIVEFIRATKLGIISKL